MILIKRVRQNEYVEVLVNALATDLTKQQSRILVKAYEKYPTLDRHNKHLLCADLGISLPHLHNNLKVLKDKGYMLYQDKVYRVPLKLPDNPENVTIKFKYDKVS